MQVKLISMFLVYGALICFLARMRASPTHADNDNGSSAHRTSRQASKGKQYHSDESFRTLQSSREWVRGAKGNARITSYHLKKGYLKEAAISTAATCIAGANCAKERVKSVFHGIAAKMSIRP